MSDNNKAFLVLEHGGSNFHCIEFYPDGEIYADARDVIFRPTSTQRRALFQHLLQEMVRDKVRVSKSRQEVTFPFRDEICDVWTFRAGIENVVHYIEPPSDPIVSSSIRVEEFEKAEDLQVCLAAAIAFRDERRREAGV